jgi:hypothetical protein
MKENNDLIKFFAVGAAAYFLLLKPILEKLGISKTSNEIKEVELINKQNISANSDSPFSGSVFLKSFPKNQKYTSITPVSAAKIAKGIFDSFTNFGDNELKIIGIFKQFNTQAQVAVVAQLFYKTYSKDLWSFLKQGKSSNIITNLYGGLNNQDLNTILNIVQKLPKYK